MTETLIDQLEAGPALDALVAEEVMGWIHRPGAICEWESPDRPHPPGTAIMRWHDRVPPFSTDIAAAWDVVDVLSQVTLTMLIGRWRCVCFNGIGGTTAEGETAPLAICRASLKALEGVK